MQESRANPYQAYKEQSIMTMTRGEMLVKLYDEILKCLASAQIGIDEKEYDTVNTKLQKAHEVIAHLRAGLNHDYEISANLDALYEYFLHTVVQANMKKDKEMIDEIFGMVSELKDTFIKADRAARIK